MITEMVRAAVGGFFVLYVPGYFLSFLFLTGGKVDGVERAAISFALSVAVVPLIAFYMNLVGVKISAFSVLLEVLGIVACCVAFLYYKNIYSKRGVVDPERPVSRIRHGHVVDLSRRDPPLTVLHESLRGLTAETSPESSPTVLQNKWFLASREVFQIALLTYMLFVVVETVLPGIVGNFFNMNYLLVLVLVSGIVMVLTERTEEIQDLTD